MDTRYRPMRAPRRRNVTATARWVLKFSTPRNRTRPPPANGLRWRTCRSLPLRKSQASFAMFVPRWMNTRPSNDRPRRPRLVPYPACRAARAPTKPGIRDATRNGARSAWTQSLATGTGPGGVNGCVMPMKPACCPARTIGRTVSTARKVEPSFRMRVTSSSNFPCSTASRRRRGTSVGTFFGTWNIATDILPMTSSCVHPNRSAASAAYSCTMPCVSQEMTEVLDSKGCPAIANCAPEPVSRSAWRLQGMRHPHVADLLPASKHPTNGEPSAEDIAVLAAEGDLFLELPVLDGFLQETRNEGRHVLREMERRDAQLADDFGGRPPEQLAGVRRVLLDDPLHVTRDDGRLRLERLLGHGTPHEIEGPHVKVSSGLPVNRSPMKRLELTVP